MPRRYLVVGGSIAGPAAAYFLKKGAPAATVVIVERAPEFRDGGQNIDVQDSRAEAVLRAMGQLEAVRAMTTGETATRFVREDGSTIALLPAGQGPTQEIEILRGDLARVMMDACVALGVEIRYGTTVTAIDQTSSHVRATFNNGASTEDFDVLIAADGTRSRTRGLFMPKAATTKIPFGMQDAFMTIPRIDSDDTTWRWYIGTDRRAVCIRPDPHGTARACLSFTQRDSILDMTREQQERFLRETFKDCGWQTQRVLDAMSGAKDLYCSELAAYRNDVYHSGRCVLLGDAAWGVGMGTTSEALIGGYVLAGELLKHGDGNPQAAFTAYEAIMRPIANPGTTAPPYWLMHPPGHYGRLATRALVRTVAFVVPTLVRLWALLPEARRRPKLPRYEHLPYAE